VAERQEIRGMLFTGFRRCLYPVQRFQTDPERRFALLLEDEPEDLKWFKPAPGQFRIYYNREQTYEPDFCVETSAAKYLCEPKRASDMEDADVRAKARAAVTWCRQATDGGKAWSYLLIPHDAIDAGRRLTWLAERFTLGPDDLEK
jgi:type III restriction enzyme